MNNELKLTEGKILFPLLRFTIPIMFALILQALYGAVDLLIVGQFSSPASVSAIATGSQVLQTLSVIITGLSMGVTIILGHQFGQHKEHEIGDTIGAGIFLFIILSIILTGVMLLCTPLLVTILEVPYEAKQYAIQYIMICSIGIIFITSYNTLGSIFRGIGDSDTPLYAVLIACVINVILDLLFIAVLKLGTAGAALATILAQASSVILSIYKLHKHGFAFPFSVHQIRFQKSMIKRICKLGIPCALQDFLISISFIVITAIVNQLGVTISAGVGVAEKICAFILLIPSAYMQSLSAFVAQNIGAQQPKRARKGLYLGILTSLCCSIIMSYLSFFHGNLLSRIFTNNTDVLAASSEYLKGYAIDTLLASFLFCLIGYLNGRGHTTFLMFQGIIGAFLIRIPFAYFASRAAHLSLFHIALATPCSSLLQIFLCISFLSLSDKKDRLH